MFHVLSFFNSIFLQHIIKSIFLYSQWNIYLPCLQLQSSPQHDKIAVKCICILFYLFQKEIRFLTRNIFYMTLNHWWFEPWFLQKSTSHMLMQASFIAHGQNMHSNCNRGSLPKRTMQTNFYDQYLVLLALVHATHAISVVYIYLIHSSRSVS